MKILCSADFHIGRRSSRLPAHLDGERHSPAEAWTRCVDRAIAERVDLLVVAGDLIDHDNRFLEAIGAVEAGVRRLRAAGVQVAMVAGNHDHALLPAIVDALAGEGEDGGADVRLLGRGGVWERMTLQLAGGTLHVDGWSFPRPHVTASPLATYAPERKGEPTLALLHADVDQVGSRYAPLALPEMRAHPGTCFVLGHVHAPRALREPGGACFVYPGSPQALDPAETGSRGVCLLELTGEEVGFRMLPLSTVRYDTIELSADGLERAEGIDARLYEAARGALAAAVEADGEHLRHLRLRLRVVGRTPFAREIESRLGELAGDLDLTLDAASASIESVACDFAPAHDLAGLAGGIGAPAELARLLLAVDSAAGRRLAAEVARVAAEVHGSRAFVEVGGGLDDLAALEAQAEVELRRAAVLLLDELMAQKAEDR